VDKQTTDQVAITVADFAGMQWDFWEHNTKPTKGVELRMVCKCDGCEMLRRMDMDDWSIWPRTRAGQLAKGTGVDREEYIRIVTTIVNEGYEGL